VDPKHAVKLLKRDEELWNDFVQVIGGRKELALEIARSLSLQMSSKNLAQVLGLSPSGSRKRLKKIKGKQAPKSDLVSRPSVPKVTRKRPSPKKPP
jgi:hypothetical protein